LEEILASLVDEEGGQDWEMERDNLFNGVCVLQEKIYLPVGQNPKFNFMGKILGPGAQNLKKLQEESKTKMVINGRGSVGNKARAAEMINTGDPKFDHLHDDLHLKISAKASRIEAFRRVSKGCELAQPFLVPDQTSQDNFYQQHPKKEYPPPEKRRSSGGAPTPPPARHHDDSFYDERDDEYAATK